jgi:predicted DNA repair protein MutK
MAASLLLLLDDIASVLDDVATMTKVAATKTAGVVGDDLALNAKQVIGVDPARELAVVWAVAKGSAINKLILVPLALLIATFAPWGITPLLMIGGLYLCFEGCEKLAHHFFHRKDKSPAEAIEELTTEVSTETEAQKIKGAVRTDFVLSAEIIAITLGTLAGQDFQRQLIVLSAISIIMTVGVYGLVGGIVKLDDAGLYLTLRRGNLQQRVGHAILWFAPFLMKTLSIAGTAAMFLVGGGIITHGIPWLHHSIEHAAESLRHLGSIGPLLAPITPMLLNGICGIIAGTLVLVFFLGFQKIRGKKLANASH